MNDAKSIVQWEAVETILLDMDGTLLDLKFDNQFWQWIVPTHFARLRGLQVEQARQRLLPLYRAKEGTLEWYCLDYWSRELGFDVLALKRSVEDQIKYLPNVPKALEHFAAGGKRLVLVTNAHRDALRIKIERTGLNEYFQAVYSAHDFGSPKEDQSFWSFLSARESFVPARTLLADDSLPVLRSAYRFGIAQVVAIAKPDSTEASRQITEFPSVSALHQLIPGWFDDRERL